MAKQYISNTNVPNWAEFEFAHVKFGDERLKKRLVTIADRFAEAPECPINQAFKDWAETKAAYRFFQNDSVSPEEILKSHNQRTCQRMNHYDVVLSIQDTCYLTYSTHKKTTGLGIISKTKGMNVKNIQTQGILMHSSFVVSPLGLPLGFLHQKIYTRKPLSDEERALRRKNSHLPIPIEDKESFRWIEAMRAAKEAGASSPVRIVTICDREGDFYELFYEAEGLEIPILIRAEFDRAINKSSPYSRRENERLWETLSDQKPCGCFDVEVRANASRGHRTAHLELKFKSIIINPTPHCYRLGLRADLTLSAIYVTEPNPPVGTEPIDWMLITNLPVEDFSDALEKVHWYALRWHIEVFHKVLKSGFKVEECRLQSFERLARYLTVMSIIAWRIYKVNLLARENPETPCTVVLTKEEWNVLYCKIKKTHHLPKETPSIYDAVRWIAMLGGFLGRKSDGEPGTITLWRGWKRLFDLTEGWRLAAEI